MSLLLNYLNKRHPQKMLISGRYSVETENRRIGKIMTSVRLKLKLKHVDSVTDGCFYLGIDCGAKFRSGCGVTEDLRNTLHKMSRK